MYVDGERFGFVEQLQARTEGADQHTVPLAVEITYAPAHIDQRARIVLWRKCGANIGPVGAEMREQFLGKAGPVLDGDDQLTGEHRIFFQQCQDLLFLTELTHKSAKRASAVSPVSWFCRRATCISNTNVLVKRPRICSGKYANSAWAICCGSKGSTSYC